VNVCGAVFTMKAICLLQMRST